jgi:hypothetical protein
MSEQGAELDEVLAMAYRSIASLYPIQRLVMKPRSFWCGAGSGRHPMLREVSPSIAQRQSARRYSESARARISRSVASSRSKYSRQDNTPASSSPVSIVDSSTRAKRCPDSMSRK